MADAVTNVIVGLRGNIYKLREALAALLAQMEQARRDIAEIEIMFEQVGRQGARVMAMEGVRGP